MRASEGREGLHMLVRVKQSAESWTGANAG